MIQGFLHCVMAPENAFLSYFYSKYSHNSAENDRIEKKIKLVLTC